MTKHVGRVRCRSPLFHIYISCVQASLLCIMLIAQLILLLGSKASTVHGQSKSTHLHVNTVAVVLTHFSVCFVCLL
jgi:hypothetical protein